jgi:uncharacterized Zn finger protein
MSAIPYRYRRCPECRATFPAGELRVLRYGAGHYHKKGGSLRRCPECGHTGFTQAFVVVADKRQAVSYGMLN